MRRREDEQRAKAIAGNEEISTNVAWQILACDKVRSEYYNATLNFNSAYFHKAGICDLSAWAIVRKTKLVQ